jgi:hypothetical protein
MLESGTPVPPGLAARWFRALYETPLMFSGILGADGRVLDGNALSIEGCGLERAEVIGTPFWECGWNRGPGDCAGAAGDLEVAVPPKRVLPRRRTPARSTSRCPAGR